MTSLTILCDNSCAFDCSNLWSAITAVSTLILAILTILIFRFAKGEFKTSNKIANADFSLRLKNDFFTKETRELFTLFENNLMMFKSIENKEDNISFRYFEIDKSKLNKHPEIGSIMSDKTKIIYSENEVADILLNHFEDLGIYEENKQISIDFIYEGFSNYIETVYENEQIQKYLKNIRSSDTESADYFDKFESIYKKIRDYGSTKSK